MFQIFNYKKKQVHLLPHSHLPEEHSRGSFINTASQQMFIKQLFFGMDDDQKCI